MEQKLQERTNDPDSRLADYFDFFAGTSTGGILTCLLLCPDEQQPLRPKFSAAEAVQLYKTLGGEIFRTSLWSKTINFKSLFNEKYSAKPLEDELKKYFANTRISQLLKPCIIPSYNIQERKTHFFAQQDYLRYGDGTDFYLKEVCRATSAAPTYFEPALVKSISGVSYPMIDGGMFANNPSLCAYSEVRNSTGAPSAKDMFLISIGTGSESLPYPYPKAKKWGGLGWIKPSIDIMMSGAAETTNYHMVKMFEANGNGANYIRIQPANLRNANPEMDDASEENRQALSEVGIKTAQECDQVDKKYLCTEMAMKCLERLSFLPAMDAGVPVDLSIRELEILQLIAEGYTNAEMSDKLFISKRTVEGYRQNLIDKTNSKNTAALIRYAITNGIIN